MDVCVTVTIAPPEPVTTTTSSDEDWVCLDVSGVSLLLATELDEEEGADDELEPLLLLLVLVLVLVLAMALLRLLTLLMEVDEALVVELLEEEEDREEDALVKVEDAEVVSATFGSGAAPTRGPRTEPFWGERFFMRRLR